MASLNITANKEWTNITALLGGSEGDSYILRPQSLVAWWDSAAAPSVDEEGFFEVAFVNLRYVIRAGENFYMRAVKGDTALIKTSQV